MKCPPCSVSAPAPSVAVIVPNYNEERHLSRCIRSVLDQAVPPEELIVVDDCSIDGSVPLIRKLIDGRTGVKLIENTTNLGTYGAVEVGLRHTRAEYVLFLSANDFVLPGLFAQAKRCLAAHPGAGMWSAMGWLVDEDDRPIRLQPIAVPALEDAWFSPEQCARMAWRFGSWFTGTTLVYRRDLLESVGGFDPALKGLSDLVAALMVAGKGGAVFSPHPYAVIRVHADSYLRGTLGNPAALETIIAKVEQRGAAFAPELFTPQFVRRTAQRFRFAAVRASEGQSLSALAGASGSVGRATMSFADALLSAKMRLARIAVAFLVLRPFDLWPSLWNRCLGTWLVARKQSVSPPRSDVLN